MYLKAILKRQLCIEFDFSQDYAGPDLRNCRNLEDAVVEKSVVRLDIGRDNFQDVIGLARGAVALGDFRARGDLTFELLHTAFCVTGEMNMSERADMQAKLFAIEQRGVPLDHAGLLHVLDTPPARSARKPDLVGYLLNRTAGVQLQKSQDFL